MSQEMGVFDSQESAVDPNNIQEKDYQLLVAQMLDNPKVDKKMMLNVFLNQMQMSGDLPNGMNKQLKDLQRGLKADDTFQGTD